MTFILVLVYAAIAIFLIWWALRGAKKLDVDHGQHAHEAPHGQHEETRSATPQDSDDLTLIRGIGAVISAKLRTLGITTYEQIAALNDADIERINRSLSFKGRIEREQWVQQAQEILARRR